MILSNATVAQVLIPVDDLENGVSFYRDTLGLPLMFTAPPQTVGSHERDGHRWRLTSSAGRAAQDREGSTVECRHMRLQKRSSSRSRALDATMPPVTRSDERPAARVASRAVGALALGALAIGALAIGALAMARLAIGRARISRLEIDACRSAPSRHRGAPGAAESRRG